MTNTRPGLLGVTGLKDGVTGSNGVTKLSTVLLSKTLQLVLTLTLLRFSTGSLGKKSLVILNFVTNGGGYIASYVEVARVVNILVLAWQKGVACIAKLCLGYSSVARVDQTKFF
jgi:hypothetical protein